MPIFKAVKQFLSVFGPFCLLALLLGGLSQIPPVLDRWEVPVAEVSREMLVSGNLVQAQLNFVAQAEITPLFHWWQMLWFRWLGPSVLGIRLPAILLFLGTLLSMWYISYRKQGAEAAQKSLILAGSSIPLLFSGGLGLPQHLGHLLLCCGLFFLYQMDQAAEANKRETSAYLAGIIFALLGLAQSPILAAFGCLSYVLYLVWQKKWPHFANLGRALLAWAIVSLSWLLLHALLLGELSGSLLLSGWAVEWASPAAGMLEVGEMIMAGLMGGGWWILFWQRTFPQTSFTRFWVLAALVGGLGSCWLVPTLGSQLVLWPLFPLAMIGGNAWKKQQEGPGLIPTWQWLLAGLQGLAGCLFFIWLGQSGDLGNAWLAGAGFLLFSASILFLWQQKRFSYLIPMQIVGSLVLISFMMGKLLPEAVANSPQAAPQAFFSQLPPNQVYVHTEGYHSYLPHFEAESVPPTRPELDWLDEGEGEQEVFVVADSARYQAADFQQRFRMFETLYRQNGFVFLRRKKPEVPRLSYQF